MKDSLQFKTHSQLFHLYMHTRKYLISFIGKVYNNHLQIMTSRKKRLEMNIPLGLIVKQLYEIVLTDRNCVESQSKSRTCALSLTHTQTLADGSNHSQLV